MLSTKSSNPCVCAFRWFALLAAVVLLDATLSVQALQVTKLIGKGCEGEVFSARETGASDDTLAVKVIKENKREYFNLVDIEQKVSAVPEHRRHLVLRARNYADMQQVQLPNGERAENAIVLPLYKDGDLRKLLSHQITKSSLLSISRSILYGLKLLHQTAGYVHGDLKPGNILVQRAGNEIFASITDFGLASPIDQVTDIGKGTWGYYPPEHLEARYEQAHRRRPVRRTAAFDVFSFGSVLYQLALGSNVDAGTLQTLQIESSETPELFELHLPETLRSIVMDCWNLTPAMRPTIEQLLDALDVYAQDRTRSSTILRRLSTCFSGK